MGNHSKSAISNSETKKPNWKGNMGKENIRTRENETTKAIMSIIRTADVINRILEIELRSYSTSPARFSVMNALIVHGGKMSPSDISKWIFRAKHTVTSMLGILENIGYVKREPNGDDRRSVNIVVTKKGWRATDSMMPNAETIGRNILSCLDEKEIENLTDLLKRIRKHLFQQKNIAVQNK